MSSETNISSVTLLAALRFAAGTDIGLRREENQDAHGIIEGNSYRAFFVCDGMGGVQGGAIASNLAISSIRELLKDRMSVGVTEIASAITQANANIFERGASEPGLAGMGTTCVGLVFTENHLFIANVGDSRAYRIRGDKVEQLTEDHTLVQELVKSGAITPEQAGNHPVSHMLTRSLGPTPSIEVDCFAHFEPPLRGDRYLICCDGLFNMVGAEEFPEILSSFSLNEAVQELIDLANLRGGTDNITLIVVEVGEEYPRAPEPEVEPTSEAVEVNGEIPHGEDRVNGVASEPPVEEPQTDGADKVSQVSGEKAEAPPKEESKTGRPASAAGGSQTFPKHSEEMKTGETFVSIRERLPKLHQWFGSIGTLAVVLLVGYGIGFVTSNYIGEDEGPMMSALPKVTPGAVPTQGLSLEQIARELNVQPAPEATVVPPVVLDPPAPNDRESERERMRNRFALLKKNVGALDAKIQSFNRPISGELGETLNSTRKAIEGLEGELERIRADLDVATRRLAVWYGRRKRLQDADPINLASEVAVAAPDVRKGKEAFEQATWEYLQQAEVLRYSPNNKEQGEKVAALARARTERMSILAQTVRGAIEREVGLADRHISELTLKRDEREEELAVLRRDIEYVKILTGADASARAAKRAELQRERDIAAAELAGLASMFDGESAENR
ncbi:MAG: hypothetical protein RL417_2237 [Pseudomonadota bacterium]